MWKKSIPMLAVSALLLVGCNHNGNGALPANNETPMEDNVHEWNNNNGTLNRNHRLNGENGNGLNNGMNNGGVITNDGNTIDGTNVHPNATGTNDLNGPTVNGVQEQGINTPAGPTGGTANGMNGAGTSTNTNRQ